jgi:hypothetical protein
LAVSVIGCDGGFGPVQDRPVGAVVERADEPADGDAPITQVDIRTTGSPRTGSARKSSEYRIDSPLRKPDSTMDSLSL